MPKQFLGDCERENAAEEGTYFSISDMWIPNLTFSASQFVFLT